MNILSFSLIRFRIGRGIGIDAGEMVGYDAGRRLDMPRLLAATAKRQQTQRHDRRMPQRFPSAGVKYIAFPHWPCPYKRRKRLWRIKAALPR